MFENKIAVILRAFVVYTSIEARHNCAMDSTKPDTIDAMAALRHIRLEEFESRIPEFDGDQASLSLLRCSLVDRRRAQSRTNSRSVTGPKADGRSNG